MKRSTQFTMKLTMLKTMMTLGAVLICVTSLAATAAEKTLIDYFLPMPVRGGLTTNLWGAPDRKSTRLNSSHLEQSRMPSSA